MRRALYALIALASAACWNVSTSGNDAGTTGTGGDGGSATCASCGKVVLAGEPSASLCSASANLFEQLQTCACDQGPCAADCYGSLCSGGAAETACKACLQSQCASKFANCSNDQSTH